MYVFDNGFSSFKTACRAHTKRAVSLFCDGDNLIFEPRHFLCDVAYTFHVAHPLLCITSASHIIESFLQMPFEHVFLSTYCILGVRIRWQK